MALFSPYMVDESRKKKALAGDLTPVQVCYEDQSAKFVGSDGGIYDTTLDRCTCVDFSLNLGQMGCCKHMIRLAMELGLYDKTGMVSDPDASKGKYYMGILRTFIHEAPLDKAVEVQQMIDNMSIARASTNDDALSFAGIPSLLNSGLFTTKGAKAKIVPEKYVFPIFFPRTELNGRFQAPGDHFSEGLLSSHILHVLFHPGRAVILHSLRYMAVNAEGESGGSMTEIALHGFITPAIKYPQTIRPFSRSNKIIKCHFSRR